jgi:hypothetical protein
MGFDLSFSDTSIANSALFWVQGTSFCIISFSTMLVHQVNLL